MILFFGSLAALTILAVLCLWVPWQKRESSLEINSVWADRAWRIAAIILLPVCALAAYLMSGSAGPWLSYEKERSALLQKKPDALLAEVRQAAMAHPNDPQGWYLLAHLYLREQNFELAIESFSKLIALMPDNIQFQSERLQARYLAAGQTLTPQIQQEIKKILKQDPQDNAVNNLLALDAYRHQDYAQAITRWEKLLARYPSESADAKSLKIAIQQAQELERQK